LQVPFLRNLEDTEHGPDVFLSKPKFACHTSTTMFMADSKPHVKSNDLPDKYSHTAEKDVAAPTDTQSVGPGDDDLVTGQIMDVVLAAKMKLVNDVRAFD
jgi:hypothetical protein